MRTPPSAPSSADTTISGLFDSAVRIWLEGACCVGCGRGYSDAYLGRWFEAAEHVDARQTLSLVVPHFGTTRCVTVTISSMSTKLRTPKSVGVRLPSDQPWTSMQRALVMLKLNKVRCRDWVSSPASRPSDHTFARTVATVDGLVESDTILSAFNVTTTVLEVSGTTGWNPIKLYLFCFSEIRREESLVPNQATYNSSTWQARPKKFSLHMHRAVEASHIP